MERELQHAYPKQTEAGSVGKVSTCLHFTLYPAWLVTDSESGWLCGMEGTFADPRHNSHFISCLHSSLLQVSGPADA